MLDTKKLDVTAARPYIIYMKVGDLVKALYLHGDSAGTYQPDAVGVIVAKVKMQKPYGNDVFKIVWTCGGISERMWDYDLRKVEA